MSGDAIRLSDHAEVSALSMTQDFIGQLWHCHTHLEKFWGDQTDDPYDIVDIDGNALTYIGASSLFERLIGTAVTAFDNTNGCIGVGDSTTALATPQNATDLQASTNKLRKGMDTTYPQHTAGGAVANASIVYRATFASAEANYAWNEWGIFNSITAGAGQMLNRKVESLGTKAVNSTWQLTITLSLA